MKITLNIEGKEKSFVNDFVNARTFRKALELNEFFAQQKNLPLSQQFDKLAEFTVVVFKNQFTLDELWDGLSAENLQNELMRIFNEVLGLSGFVLKEAADNQGK